MFIFQVKTMFEELVFQYKFIHQDMVEETEINPYTVKPVLSGHSQIDKTKILMIDGSLLMDESIA